MANAVYDDEKEKSKDKNGAHDDLGVHPERREAETDELEKMYAAPSSKRSSNVYDDDGEQSDKDSEAMSPEEVESAEEAANEPSRSKAEDTERNESVGDDTVGSGYKDDSKGDKKRFWTPRKIIAGGGIATLGIGGFLLFSTLQGPLQFIHLAQLMQGFHFSNNEEFTGSRAGRLLKWARTVDSPERRNLGFLGNRMADHYHGKFRQAGFELNFTTPDGTPTRTIQDLRIDPDSPQGQKAVTDLTASGVDVDSLPRAPDGKIIIETQGRGHTRQSRGIIKMMSRSLGVNRVSTFLASRLLSRRAGVPFKVFTGARKAASDTYVGFKERARRSSRDRIRNGVDPPEGRLAAEGGTDANGDTVDPDPDHTDAANEGNDARGDATSDSPRSTRASRVKARVGTAAGFVGVACLVRTIGNQADQVKHANIVLPLIRVAMEAIVMGNQIMSGDDVSLDELSAFYDRFYDEETQSSWAGAMSIQDELGQGLNGMDIPPEAKPGGVGERPAIFNIVDGIPGIGGLCSAIGQFILGAVTPIQTVFTEGVLYLSRQLTGTDPIQLFVDSVVGLISGEEINTEAAGAVYGNYVNYGSRLAANDMAAGMGGVPLTGTETAQLDAAREEAEVIEFQQKSFFARTFDLYEPQSLAARALLESPTLSSTSNVATSLAIIPGNIFSSFSSLFGVFSSGVSAQSAQEYDYGFPEFGFSQADISRMDNMDVGGQYDGADPYANAEWVSRPGVLESLQDEYGHCFNNKINPESGALEAENDGAINYNELDGCDDDSEEFLRYRFYLADMITAKTLACYEGLDEVSCSELGFGETPPPSEDTDGENVDTDTGS